MSVQSLPLQPIAPHNYSTRAEMLGRDVLSMQEFFARGSASSQPLPLKGKFVLVGIPDERGVLANMGHPGAAQGPESFRAAFYKFYDTVVREFCPRTHRPYAPTHQRASSDTRMLSSVFLDAGNIVLQPTVAETHQSLARVVEWLLEKGADLVTVVGGGHDFTYGSYAGHVASCKGIIPVVNLDAHFDLRPVIDGVINSGSAFSRVIKDFPANIVGGRALLELGLQRERNPQSLYDFALEHHVASVEYLPILNVWRNMIDAREASPVEHLLDHLDDCRHLGWNREMGSVHLSLCLDVFSAWAAPGTSASTPFGAPVEDLGPVLSFLGRTRFCRVLDVAELCPPRDVGDQTARLAASLVYKFALLREEYSAPENLSE